eukprot:jgi/Psemu1/8727/gm1.8727_g
MLATAAQTVIGVLRLPSRSPPRSPSLPISNNKTLMRKMLPGAACRVPSQILFRTKPLIVLTGEGFLRTTEQNHCFVPKYRKCWSHSSFFDKIGIMLIAQGQLVGDQSDGIGVKAKEFEAMHTRMSGDVKLLKATRNGVDGCSIKSIFSIE